MDAVQNLDPTSLVTAQAALSLLTSAFTAPPYNLPLFLFGIYAQERTDSNASLRTFTLFLAGSAVLDIVWLFRNDQNTFLRLVSVLILLLKIPTILTVSNSLRARGEQFSGFGGIGLPGGEPSTVWSMPGGFTSNRGGYQNLGGDEDIERGPTNTSRPQNLAQQPPAPAAQPPAPAPAPTSYQAT